MSTVYCYNFELDKIKPQKIYLDTIKINGFDFQVAYLGKDQQAFKDDSKIGITLFEKNLFRDKVSLDAINEFNKQRNSMEKYKQSLLNNNMISCYGFSDTNRPNCKILDKKTSYVYVQLKDGLVLRAIMSTDKDLSSNEINSEFGKILPMSSLGEQLSLKTITEKAKKVYYVTSEKCTKKEIKSLPFKLVEE